MVIKVHGVVQSTCTRRVLTALIEKGVPYELVAVNFQAAEHKSAPFLAMQPFGKIPVLDDDGFLVYESRAICKYIAKKYASQGTKLIPAEDDLKGYALFEQACSIEVSYFDPPASLLAFEKVFKVMRGGATDEALVEVYGIQLDKALAVYDVILAKQPYLAGEELTLADLFHIPYGAMARRIGYEETFNKYPHVKKWFDGLEARESWVKANLSGNEKKIVEKKAE